MYKLQNSIDDYKSFFALQRRRLTALGIDISDYPISHIAYRTASYDDYLQRRNTLEKYCRANVENVWNDRPISKLLLREALELGDGFETELIELIPSIRQDSYKLGLEHIGVVVGDSLESFFEQHRTVFPGRQKDGLFSDPFSIKFEEDSSVVKFYRYSLRTICEKDGLKFDGFEHVDNWVAGSNTA